METSLPNGLSVRLNEFAFAVGITTINGSLDDGALDFKIC